MCHTFFEIFRFFYGITHVFPRKTLLLQIVIIFIEIMQNIMKTIGATLLTLAVCLIVGCTKDNGGNGSYNGHDYIDLGLPSGTMWATCNVGAESPDQYGDYFAWGETTQKAIYNWNTYVYSNGDYNQLTKYCTQSDFGFNGFTDDLKTLQSSDDAATTNWGEGWSMPTYNQWVELLRKGCYWSCTLNKTYPDGVKGFRFTLSIDDYDIYDLSREAGMPVRAVCTSH